MGKMTNRDIRQGIAAFNVTSRLYSSDGVPLKVSRILKAIKMVNRVMSVRCLQLWIDKYRPYLMCNSGVGKLASSKKKDAALYPHEFLILLSQTRNNMQILTKVIDELLTTKLAEKDVNATLKRAEINGFEKFIRNELREELDTELQQRLPIVCPDVGRMKRKDTEHYDGFAILKNWQDQIVDNPRIKHLDCEEIAMDDTERNRDLALKHVVGEAGARKKREINDKCETARSLYSLAGAPPAFLTATSQERFLRPETATNAAAAGVRREFSPMLSSPISTRGAKAMPSSPTLMDGGRGPRNYVRLNKNMMWCHPINRNRLLTNGKFIHQPKTSRPGTAVSRTTTSSGKIEVMSRMSSLFDEEIHSMLQRKKMCPAPSCVNL